METESRGHFGSFENFDHGKDTARTHFREPGNLCFPTIFTRFLGPSRPGSRKAVTWNMFGQEGAVFDELVPGDPRTCQLCECPASVTEPGIGDDFSDHDENSFGVFPPENLDSTTVNDFALAEPRHKNDVRRRAVSRA